MALKVVDEAIVRYHKILESSPYAGLEWTAPLEERMQSLGLVAGTRLSCPFLRPHLITRKQFELLSKSSEVLLAAIERLEALAQSSPQLLQRLELLPAERMLAGVDPGYKLPQVATVLDGSLANGGFLLTGIQSAASTGLASSEALADLFWDLGPMKEFRKKHKLAKLPGTKALMSAVLKAYKAFGGKSAPQIAVLEFKQPFQTVDTSENRVLVDQLRRLGHTAELVNPEQLEYRNRELRRGDYRIDLIIRASSLQEFLIRFDLTHPLVQAYRDRSVCMVNSFGAELARKRGLFCLLTDEQVTAKFPAAEKKAIAAHIPWTRIVAPGKTQRNGETFDLPEYISTHRDDLVLVPNEATGPAAAIDGATLEQTAWDRTLKTALRERYLVQAKFARETARFPALLYGAMEYKDVVVNLHPHVFLGELKTATAFLSAGGGGFSSAEGIAPTYLLETK